jgi:hypothetical protein
MTYDVPEQDVRIDFSRVPALPHSRFVISNVKEVNAASGVVNPNTSTLMKGTSP